MEKEKLEQLKKANKDNPRICEAIKKKQQILAKDKIVKK